MVHVHASSDFAPSSLTPAQVGNTFFRPRNKKLLTRILSSLHPLHRLARTFRQHANIEQFQTEFTLSHVREFFQREFDFHVDVLPHAPYSNVIDHRPPLSLPLSFLQPKGESWQVQKIRFSTFLREETPTRSGFSTKPLPTY